MTLNNNTKLGKSQQLPLFLFFIIPGMTIFSLLLFSDIALPIKLVITTFSALIPVFIMKPEYFLYFIFLITPSIRVISQKEVILDQYPFLNFNAVLHVSIIGIGMLILLANWKKITDLIKNTGFLFLTAVLLFYATLSLLYSADKVKTVEELVRTASIFFVFILAFSLTKSKKVFLGLLASMVAGAVLPSLVGLWQFKEGTGWYDTSINRYRVYGTLIHPATFAFYLLSLIPVNYAFFKNSKTDENKFLPAAIIVLFIFLIAASLTRGAWIAFVAMLGVYGLFRNRKALFVMMAGLFLAYLAVPAINSRVNDIFNPQYNSSFTARLKIAERTAPAFWESPLVGKGFGTFELINIKYNEEARFYESLAAHNDYLRIIIELGLMGIIIFLSLHLALFIYFIRAYQQTNDAALKNHIFSLLVLWVGAMVIAAGDNLLRTVPVEYVLWGYTGAVMGRLREKL